MIEFFPKSCCIFVPLGKTEMVRGLLLDGKPPYISELTDVVISIACAVRKQDEQNVYGRIFNIKSEDYTVVEELLTERIDALQHS